MSAPKKRLTLRENNKLEGQYDNYFKVGHNAYEFVIDFGQYYPENDQAELYTRIITSPCYAKEGQVQLQFRFTHLVTNQPWN